MMPVKKVEYYAKKHGVADYQSVRLTDEDVAGICDAVGSRRISASDCGGRLSPLIDLITDDGAFIAKVRSSMGDRRISEDFFLIRLADHAADGVMAAYAASK